MKAKIKYTLEDEEKEIIFKNITELPKDIIYLSLTNEKLKEFNCDMFLKLKKLDLRFNKIEKFICNICELEILNISFNNLIKFTLKGNSSLKWLDISFNNLTEFSSINNLKYLNISFNKLIIFDCNISNELEELNISNNNLTEFTLKDNSSLKYLNISKNLLESFKSDRNLQKLNISLNKLKEIMYNENLKELDASSNNLYMFNPCDNLTKVKLYENKFINQKIINRKRIYLLRESEEGPVENVRESKEGISTGLKVYNKNSKCYKCKRNVDNSLKINKRRLIYLNNNITCETCC